MYKRQLLGEEGVNIGQMAVGRYSNKSDDSRAIGVLNMDSTANESVLQRITENESIQSADIIKLPAIKELPDWLS